MHTVRHLGWTSLAAAMALMCAGTAPAQDSLGGFSQAFTNGGNVFGHGGFGNGRGTAIPLPNPQPEFGFYFGRPFDGGNNLFGSGFWTAEFTVRDAETIGDTGPRFIPYARRELVPLPRNYSSVVVVDYPQTAELGELHVVSSGDETSSPRNHAGGAMTVDLTGLTGGVGNTGGAY